MIPYIDFGFKHRQMSQYSDPDNPFTDRDKPFVALIDSNSFSDNETLEFLLRQSEAKFFFTICTKKGGNALLQYNSGDFEQIRTFTIELLAERTDWTYSYQKVGFSKFFGSSYELYYRHYKDVAPGQEIQNAWLITQTFAALEEAHILVTNNDFLLKHCKDQWFADASPLHITEAMALTGLRQRRRGNSFRIIKHLEPNFGKIAQKYGSMSFFHAACTEVLTPSVSGYLLDKKADNLKFTLLSRMSNILQCRDYIHEQLLLEQTGNSVDTAGFYLEYYFVLLKSTFDTLAKIADILYEPLNNKGVRFQEKEVGWHYDWSKALNEQNPSFAQIMGSESVGGYILSFTRTFRNYYVHLGESLVLQHIDASYGKRARSALFQVPPNNTQQALAVLHKLFKQDCNIYQFSSKKIFLEAGQIVELLTPRFFKVMEDLLSIIAGDGHINKHKPSEKLQDPFMARFSDKQIDDVRNYLGIYTSSL